ncbi:MAG TPA: hypothetical protein VGM88_03555 [Kofleriaceae bacterium]|jgi:hypothetical protein
MKLPLLRSTALALTVTTAMSVSGCAWMLHPERRGNTGGAIDGGMLVCDILWFLPGIIPGVVFLIVDFTSGAIYVHGRMAMRTSPTNVAIGLDAQKAAKTLDIQVLQGDHIIDERTAMVGPGVAEQYLNLTVGDTKTAQTIIQVRDAAHPEKLLQSVSVR